MSHCPIDHTIEDVTKKLVSQEEYLPSELYLQIKMFLKTDQSQEILNDCFHLLKKYDLASKKEQKVREQKLINLVG